MADSSFDNFVQGVEAQLADSTVLFTEGKTGKEHGKRDQTRRVSFERHSGKVKLRSSPTRLTTGSAPVKMNRFTDESRIRMTVAAEDENTTFQLFTNVLNAIFEIMGPDAFNDENEYDWGGEDSKGGGHVVRQPILIFELYVRLKMQPPSVLSQVIDDATLNFTLEAPIQ
jgi:hypothetical protein